MDLELLGAHWNRHGELDPMWAIMTVPDRDQNRWDKREFFRSGMSDISQVMHSLRETPFRVRRRRALDFGCGLGRLTQALTCYFDEVDGVDIAPSMIEQAQFYNPYPERCQYHVNQRDDLRMFEDNRFDFILTLMVLQHMRPDYSKSYIAEFLRVLAPGGLLIFQQPSHRSPRALELEYEPRHFKWRRSAKRQMMGIRYHLAHLAGGPARAKAYDFSNCHHPKHERLDPVLDWGSRRMPENSSPSIRPSGTRQQAPVIDKPVMEHHPIERGEMLAYLRSLGGKVVDVRERGDCDPFWHSYRYYVTK